MTLVFARQEKVGTRHSDLSESHLTSRCRKTPRPSCSELRLLQTQHHQCQHRDTGVSNRCAISTYRQCLAERFASVPGQRLNSRLSGTAFCMDGSIHFGAVSAASLSPTSPVSVRSHAGANGAAKRKRSAAGTIDSSPGSVLHDHDDDTLDQHEKKRQPGVKRACNECRQQKVSH